MKEQYLNPLAAKFAGVEPGVYPIHQPPKRKRKPGARTIQLSDIHFDKQFEKGGYTLYKVRFSDDIAITLRGGQLKDNLHLIGDGVREWILGYGTPPRVTPIGTFSEIDDAREIIRELYRGGGEK